ncbi:hypothetical protein [Gymnodinialimonas ceratoperidinii]|uniref:Uncharacterized protein n=1 Tax=Gymnodinialimonas ceratoperidinii TaxID=2856823 RepID=A0A8F6TX52_9RHOB|nr:hypothetical protein [Gymnodinialimonas ceratoperidinii]QXT39554.1 hypothetical protein KYE46_16795 [Gymnodinialimonas ceratoperidinii]
MTEGRAWRGLAGLTAALYGGLAWLWFAALVPEAGGMSPFDARLAGYSAAEGRAFLQALSDQGRAVYLGDVHRLDTVFPIALAALLGWPLWRRPSGAWRILALLPLFYLGADLIENARVAALLRAEAPSDPMFLAASRATVTKYAFLILSAIALGGVYMRTRTL